MNQISFRAEPAKFSNHVVRSDRDNEYQAFVHATRALQTATAESGLPTKVAAVQRNTELWTLLASDLAHDDNRLPDEVKAGLIGLALFSIRQGQAVLLSGAEIEPLIDVNLQIMKGLRAGAAR